MLITKEVEVKWHNSNKRYYVEKGYNFSKYGDVFIVKVEDLSPQCTKDIVVQCDYCGTKIVKKYFHYLRQRKIIEKDCCKSCSSIKNRESNLKIYNVENPMKLPQIQEKFKKTMLERYNVEHPAFSKEIVKKRRETLFENYGVYIPLKSEIIKEKVKQTNLLKYGVEYPTQNNEVLKKSFKTKAQKYGYEYPFLNPDFYENVKQNNLAKYGVLFYSQTEEFKNKFKQTCLEKYGVENPNQVDEIKLKQQNTNLKRYGVKYVGQNLEVRAKINQSLYKNGTAPSSRQQEYLNKLFDGELNYPLQNLQLDIAFPKEKIYIEYDGSGHNLQVLFGAMSIEEFNKKEIKRQYYLRNQGWKLIKIISTKDYLPSDDILINLLNHVINYLNDNHTWFEIDIDNSRLRSSQYEIDYDFGKLRRIKDTLIS